MTRDRLVEVRVGPSAGAGKLFKDLYVRCRVNQTSGRKPNKAKATIFNLSKDSIRFLERPGHIMQISAGETIAGQVFFGDVTKRSVKTSWQIPDRPTEILAADGRRAFRSSKYSKSFPAQTARSVIFGDLLTAMGPGRGLVDPTIPERVYPAATVWHGPGRDVMSKLWATDGAVGSISNGAVDVLPKGLPAKRKAILVSGQTGMIGEPTRTDKGIEVKLDLNPEVRPGAVIVVPSILVTGGWRVVTADHDFDTFGDAWETTAKAVAY